MPTWLEVIIGVLTAVSLLAALLVGLVVWVVRYVGVPWMQTHLIGPLAERFDTITERFDTISQEVRIAGLMWDGHVENSALDRAALHAAVTELQDDRRSLWRAINALRERTT